MYDKTTGSLNPAASTFSSRPVSNEKDCIIIIKRERGRERSDINQLIYPIPTLSDPFEMPALSFLDSAERF